MIAWIVKWLTLFVAWILLIAAVGAVSEGLGILLFVIAGLSIFREFLAFFGLTASP